MSLAYSLPCSPVAPAGGAARYASTGLPDDAGLHCPFSIFNGFAFFRLVGLLLRLTLGIACLVIGNHAVHLVDD